MGGWHRQPPLQRLRGGSISAAAAGPRRSATLARQASALQRLQRTGTGLVKAGEPGASLLRRRARLRRRREWPRCRRAR